MEVIETIDAMRAKCAEWKRKGQTIALVPTMGALHDGHIRLMERAKELGGRVVASVFVNPTQFGPGEDFERYPRDLEGDRAKSERAGVDAVFAPSAAEIYPPGFQSSVAVPLLASKFEGEIRPGHFRGVCTVVMKLFQIVQPDAAVFGWKDAQQFLVLSRMVRDLNVPVKMVGVPTVREPDGLAMSSRNRYLTPEQRQRATCLSRALKRVHFLVKQQGIVHTGELLNAAESVVASTEGAKLDYVAIVSRATLEPIPNIERGNTIVLIAVRFGAVRLIDNTRL